MDGYDWDFSVLAPYTSALVSGALVTLALSTLSFVIGTLLGTVAGAAFRRAPGAGVLFFMNDCIRAVPVLVLLFIVYYFPTSTVIGGMALSPFWASVSAFSIAQAAYTADLVRSAIDRVPKAVLLAGHAIGLERIALWRFVVIPDVVRQTAPAQLAFFIGIVRLSSIASVIGCQDVVYVSRVISSQTFRSLEPWLLVAGIYIVIVVPLTLISRRLEGSRWLMRRG